MSTKVNSGWRTAAIIFGVLFAGMLLLLLFGMSIETATQLCTTYCSDNNYESFTYDYQTDQCTCYIGTDAAKIIKIRN